MRLTDDDIDKIFDLISIDEGFKLTPYDDSTGLPVRILTGNITIGFGRNLSSRGITRDEAKYLAKNDIKDIINYLLYFNFFDALSAQRKYVLINMVFNLGQASFNKFKKLIAALYINDYEKAADEIIDSNAERQLQGRYQRLAKIMRSGAWNDS